jgi:hypothetical protein
MFNNAGLRGLKTNGVFASVQQVRHASSKRKKRITSYRTDLRRFLGPRNFKGMYTENPFFWAPKNNTTNYMTSYTIRGADRSRDGRRHEWKRIFNNAKGSTLQPFSENQFSKSNLLIPEDLKKRIVSEFHSGNTTVQRIGVKYGISIPRIEALVTLSKIEKEFEKEVSYTPHNRRTSLCFMMI